MRYGNPGNTATIDSPRSGRSAVRNLYAGVGKRICDLLLSAMLLPLVTPVLVALWMLARLGGGPGLYAQPRVGQHGRVFRCYKIRTMVVDAERRLEILCAREPALAREWMVNQKLVHDPRITRFGAFLRRTSLDELPQLWNILLGHMSFVGPRPFTLDQEQLYRDAGGSAYFHMRPGLTGPWQLHGRGTTSFLSRVSYDEAYGRSISPWQDLLLIFQTANVVISPTGK